MRWCESQKVLVCCCCRCRRRVDVVVIIIFIQHSLLCRLLIFFFVFMEEILYRVPLIKYTYRNRYAYETIELRTWKKISSFPTQKNNISGLQREIKQHTAHNIYKYMSSSTAPSSSSSLPKLSWRCVLMGFCDTNQKAEWEALWHSLSLSISSS